MSRSSAVGRLLRGDRGLFVNYFADATRDSSVNLAVVRVLLGVYLIWKLISMHWEEIAKFPYDPLFQENIYSFLAPHPLVLEFLPVEKWIVVVLLIGFILGYRVAITGFLSAFLIAHMAGIMFMINNTSKSKTYFTAVFILVFFAIYRDTDQLSLDAVRRTKEASMAELNEYLKSPARPTQRLDVLKWSLLMISILYLGSGVGKIVRGPLFEWIEVANMNRYLLYAQLWTQRDLPVADFILQYQWLSLLSAWGTIVLEVGFVFVVLAGLTITPFIIGLAGLHIVIALALHPFFFDQFILFSFFVPWDTLYKRAASDEPISLVYDEHCYFCARSLYLFKNLDVNRTVNFYSQYDVPDEYTRRDDVDFQTAMYLFKDGDAYQGYHAFKELLRQFTVFFWLVWIMGLSPVERVGEQVYGYVAENRSRHFVCRIDASDETRQG